MSTFIPTAISIQFDGRPDSCTIETSDFQLLQWKHALRLELKGLTMSRGRKVSTHIRKLAGLKRSVKIESLLALVTDILDQHNGTREVAGIDKV